MTGVSWCPIRVIPVSRVSDVCPLQFRDPKKKPFIFLLQVSQGKLARDVIAQRCAEKEWTENVSKYIVGQRSQPSAGRRTTRFDGRPQLGEMEAERVIIRDKDRGRQSQQ